MAKTRTSNVANLKNKRAGKAPGHLHLSLSKLNYYIIAGGVLLIIIGYIFMAENSVDGFLPTVVAPIFLFIGYCIIVPIGILYKPKREVEASETVYTEETIITETKSSNVKSSSSNIKTK